MNRRHFLYTASAATAAAGTGLFYGLRHVRADDLPTSWSRKVLNVTLGGGPDFRHLIVPPPNAGTYGPTYWKYRATSHYVSEANSGEWAARYANDYLPVTTIAGTTVPEFGVLKSCAWLHAEIVAGRVGILCNVEHSTNRDHAHSLLILQSGDLETSPFSTGRDGWGGRVAAQVNGNVFSMTRQRLMYCNVPAGAASSQVVSARDTRSFGLARSVPEDYQQGGEAVTDRALTSYYAALREAGTIADASPYRRFTRHEDVLRGFTQAVGARLGTNPIPMGISGLYSGDAAVLTRNRNFGEQMRNVYDCFACEDIVDSNAQPFNFRVGSLEYGGWDSHKNQRDQIEPQLGEIFGAGKGLASLRAALEADMPGALDAHVITIAGEFGRQLRSNGDRGTDHGRANYVFVLGNAVRGGVYGEMFPMEEITMLVDGKNKYERYNQDIEGRTSLARAFGAVADWVASDDAAGDAVFPGRAASIQEDGYVCDRATLFRS